MSILPIMRSTSVVHLDPVRRTFGSHRNNYLADGDELSGAKRAASPHRRRYHTHISRSELEAFRAARSPSFALAERQGQPLVDYQVKPIIFDVPAFFQVNSMYTAVQWPIRYCCLSDDGTLLSVAGRNGLVHWSSNTGRWKMFANEAEEASFSVKGGMVWYYHVLIVATESARGTEVSVNELCVDAIADGLFATTDPAVFP